MTVFHQSEKPLQFNRLKKTLQSQEQKPQPKSQRIHNKSNDLNRKEQKRFNKKKNTELQAPDF